MPRSRRNDLINAAVTVFHRHGFHRTNIDRVLQEGGISRMTLYNHFKSKDDLILAALQRYDEECRDKLIRYVEQHATDPASRLLTIFDYYEHVFAQPDFCGCLCINASAEFGVDSPVRQAASQSKQANLAYVRTLCEAAGFQRPAHLAEQLNTLIEGAIVSAQLTDCKSNGGRPHIARVAKDAARTLINAATT